MRRCQVIENKKEQPRAMKAIHFRAIATDKGYAVTWEDLETRQIHQYQGFLASYSEVELLIDSIISDNSPVVA